MKRILKQCGQILGTTTIALAAAVACAQSARAKTEAAKPAIETTQAAETISPGEAVASRKSVFEDNLKSGKDPFYPKSTRRSEKPAATPIVAAPVVQLALKGISGPANRRFALINNQPLAAGEDGYVRVPGGQIKVHCWEIHENSVVVSVEGNPEKKELRLNADL